MSTNSIAEEVWRDIYNKTPEDIRHLVMFYINILKEEQANNKSYRHIYALNALKQIKVYCSKEDSNIYINFDYIDFDIDNFILPNPTVKEPIKKLGKIKTINSLNKFGL